MEALKARLWILILVAKKIAPTAKGGRFLVADAAHARCAAGWSTKFHRYAVDSWYFDTICAGGKLPSLTRAIRRDLPIQQAAIARYGKRAMLLDMDIEYVGRHTGIENIVEWNITITDRT